MNPAVLKCICKKYRFVSAVHMALTDTNRNCLLLINFLCVKGILYLMIWSRFRYVLYDDLPDGLQRPITCE